MNSNLDQKKVSVIEDALKMKDEGKRLSFIIAKFPDYESEIREIFGTVVFIKENKDKVTAPKNILKTLLSKIPESPAAQPATRFKKEIARENNAYTPSVRDDEVSDRDDPLMEIESGKIFGKWKIIIPVVILAIVTAVIWLRSDPIKSVEVIDENIETQHNSSESNLISDETKISSSTDEIQD